MAEHNIRELYRAVRDELVTELRPLDVATASTIVPACPDWTVKDVVAHLSGLNAELLAGVDGSIGSHEATSRQVADRSELSLSEVLDEWLSLSKAIDDRFAVDPNMAAALLADMVVHAYDIEEILHQSTTAADTAVAASAQRYVGKLQDRLATDFDTRLTIDLTDDATWPAPRLDNAAELTVQTSSFEFLRGVTGRLPRHQVEAFDWSSDPSAILDDGWNLYGPFRA